MGVECCTLEVYGFCYYAAATTERGIKHLHELSKAVDEGYHCMLAFVIQMEGIHEVRANAETHPAFGVALEEARQAGVEIVFLPCKIEEDSLKICQ